MAFGTELTSSTSKRTDCLPTANGSSVSTRVMATLAVALEGLSETLLVATFRLSGKPVALA